MGKKVTGESNDQLVDQLVEARRRIDELETAEAARKLKENALREYLKGLEASVREHVGEIQDAHEESVRRERLAVLGQLVGGVGHELRNPLGTIKTAIDVLRARLQETEPKVQEMLEILNREVAASERIINSLLDFARPAATTHCEVDVQETIQQALSRVRVPQNIEVLDRSDNGLPTILGDSDQLAQVFENIIVNAIEAMPEGGKLTIASTAPNPSSVTVSFVDTGVGISTENLDKLFEPLFTDKAGGIGLGLSITRTLVDRHGGEIEVESHERGGTTFTVTLPLDGGKGKRGAEEYSDPDSG